MSHFYLTLPSNSSMRYHPHNTAAKFTTQLPSAIDLSGDWEVALSEITYPIFIDYIKNGECYIDIYLVNSYNVRRIVLPDGYYGTLTAIINILNKLSTDKSIVLRQDDVTGKIILGVTSGREIHMSPTLCCILGFKADSYLSGSHESMYKPDIYNSIYSMFIYCDVVEPVVVGDSKVPLLRQFAIENQSSGSPIVQRSFLNPIYIPVQKKHFDSVEVNIMTDTGVPMPFTFGKSVVTLHYRRSLNPYFLTSR